ncbi:MAG TPA: sigma-70 family RNA polymerase sigma factor [Candidatus Paenibacillus intestinavium]|nr:sigma-70 family RNA polymerase sigma factor [Candidatus Paenibacillus intestinavium]
MKITEQNVVQQLHNRNERALSFIIEEYGGMLAGIIKRYVQDRHQDYEECLDDVLLAVWHHIDSFDPNKKSFKHWIAVIAKYKAIDCLRKHSALQTKQIYVPKNFDSIQIEERHEDADLVEELLAMLTTKERDIFERYYLHGIPSKELAEQYGRKESWIHNVLSRGRKKIREVNGNERI